MGFMTSLSYFGALVLQPFGGALADRCSKRALMIGSDAVCGVAMLALGGLALCGAMQVWQVLAVAAVSAVCTALFQPAVNSLIPQLVPAGDLLQASSLINGTGSALQMLGNAAGGFLTVVCGVPGIILFNGLTFLFSAATECFIRAGRAPAGSGAPGPAAVLGDLRAGICYLKGQGGLARHDAGRRGNEPDLRGLCRHCLCLVPGKRDEHRAVRAVPWGRKCGDAGRHGADGAASDTREPAVPCVCGQHGADLRAVHCGDGRTGVLGLHGALCAERLFQYGVQYVPLPFHHAGDARGVPRAGLSRCLPRSATAGLRSRWWPTARWPMRGARARSAWPARSPPCCPPSPSVQTGPCGGFCGGKGQNKQDREIPQRKSPGRSIRAAGSRLGKQRFHQRGRQLAADRGRGGGGCSGHTTRWSRRATGRT